MKDNMEDIIYKIQELSQELVDNYKIKDITLYVEDDLIEDKKQVRLSIDF